MRAMPFTLLETLSSPLQDNDQLAAVDLGSNSFHMVVARYTQGQLRVIDRLRETVRMADGLDARGGLSQEAHQRAIDCLSRFGQRIRELPASRVRALATNTVRRLALPQSFLVPAEAALGHAIEVVSGREEARLIYLGVAQAQPPKPGTRRLVIDIGGGSTEFIIGSGLQTLERESIQVGCIASTRRFFPGGKLSRKRWMSALTEITAELQQFAQQYRALGWQEAIGSSGTAKAIGDICAAMKLTKGAITAEALPQVRERLLQAERVDAIDLPSLSKDRQPIIAGGVLVMEAAFQALGIDRMMVSKAAMREGILYDMLGRRGSDDPRELSVATMMQRYGVDIDQADRVDATAQRLFEQVAKAWTWARTMPACCTGPRACTRSARPSRTASTTCTAPICSSIRTSPASRAGAADAGGPGAHAPPRHPQSGVRCPAGPSHSGDPAPGRAAAPCRAAAPRARRRADPHPGADGRRRHAAPAAGQAVDRRTPAAACRPDRRIRRHARPRCGLQALRHLNSATGVTPVCARARILAVSNTPRSSSIGYGCYFRGT